MSKYLLALDQATNITGYSVWKDQELISHGYKAFHSKDYVQRITDLRDWVESIIDQAKGNLEIAIEDIQLQDMRQSRELGLQTYKKLAQVQGALLSLFVKRGIHYHIIPAAKWRHTCKIKGKSREEQKANTQAYVKESFGLNATQDEADAICIGQHIILSGDSEIGSFNWT